MQAAANPPPILIPQTRTIQPQNLRRNVTIALPWYKLTNPLTAFSVMGLKDPRRTAISLNFGDAFVVHSRNTLADLFLQSDQEWMLTIDDDMVVPFGNAEWINAFTGMNLPKPYCDFNALDRLLSHGKTLVGALYFGRWRHGCAMFAEGYRDKSLHAYLRKGPRNELKATKWVGTGCMLIHRSVYLDIEKKFPHVARKREAGRRGGNWFTSSEHDLANGVDKALEALDENRGKWTSDDALAAFQTLTDARARSRHNSSLGTGEDVIFCHRAQAAGHQPYVDLGLICGHVGSEIYHPYNTK
jgi:hypothetical protein